MSLFASEPKRWTAATLQMRNGTSKLPSTIPSSIASDGGKILALTNLGQVFTALERYQDAEELLSRALEIQRGSPAADKHYLPVVLNNLAMVYLATGRYRRSETMLDEARAFIATQSNPEHPILVQVLNNQGILYRTPIE